MAVNIPRELIKDFVAITNDQSEKRYETVSYGTARIRDGQIFVQMDGSDILTPISRTVEVSEGDRVTVMIKNHEAVITGNITDPTGASTFNYDHTYVMDGTIATFTAHLYKGKSEVTSLYPAEQFTWYIKSEDGTSYLGSGYTIQVDTRTCGYGSEIIGKFTTVEESEALSSDGDNLQTVDGDNLTVRASGDSVRVRDLQTSTTIYPQEKIMVVGAEDEHLITVQTLWDYLDANLTKQVRFNTTAGWSVQTTLVSEPETIYVYTDHKTDSQGNKIAGVKVGDGNAYVVDLPFTDALEMEHISNTSIHISDAEREFWNNKVRCYYTGIEQLIFTTS